MPTRRDELTRQAARLFAEQGYHGTSMEHLAAAMGVQKGSLYAHVRSKADLLNEITREGAEAFHAALDGIDERLPAIEKLRLALRAHLRVVSQQLDIATVFVREWRYLEGERRDEFLAERRRYVERIRALTTADVKRVATKYIRPDKLKVIVVGDWRVIGPATGGLGLGAPAMRDQFGDPVAAGPPH